MTELNVPEHLLEKAKEAVAKEPPQSRHNWMYSFLPAELPASNTGIFLVGYCKNCNKAVSSRIYLDAAYGFPSLTEVNIPKWGCVIPEGL